jgi:signal transduction histidine kinase
MSDQAQIVLITAGLAAGVSAAGLALGWLMRRMSLRWLLTLIPVVAVAAVVAGVVGTANAMFLSRHDFTVVLWICGVAGVVAALFALPAGAIVVGWSRRLSEETRRLGESTEVAKVGGPAEIRRLSAELASTSARLKASRDREKRLEDSRRELVSGVSHDLRTPLAGLRAMTEALEDGLADDPARYYRQMRSEVDVMVRMVDDLFELSRIHAGLLPLSPQPIALDDLLSEAIAGADPVARAAGIRLGGQVDSAATVVADPTGMSRVVANLLMNAIRHTPADGTVFISGRQINGRIEVAVTDGCGGIPEADLGRVFDVAWRGSPARTPESGRADSAGAGLGLAIVKGIVEAHHGVVTVRNQQPGCCFQVLLPA